MTWLKSTRIALAGVAVAAASACAASTAPQTKPALAIEDDIDRFVEKTMAELKAPPGMAVAVYTPDGVYAKGFGVTDIDTGEAATADTVFYIASSTKSFFAMTMNILAHRGDIDLDQPIGDFAPHADFPDEISPDKVTLRDLLTHTSGIRNDYISFRAAYSGEHTPEKNWALLAASEPNERAPHGTFQYTNTGYNIFSIMTDEKFGVSWKDLIAREILAPTGLTRTTAYMSKAEKSGWSIAKGHFTGDAAGLVRIPLMKVDATMQSAGGMVMSAKDAARWLELVAEDGAVDGKQIVSAEIVRETRAPLAEVGSGFGPYKRDTYGLGWYAGPYRDETLIHHFGGFSGFRAHVSYMPEKKIGVAVFSNSEPIGYSSPDVIANFIYDRLLGDETALETATASLEDLKKRRDMVIERIAADREKRAEREWMLTLPLPAYVGVYENGLAGTVTIAVDNDNLAVSAGVLHSVSEPYVNENSMRVELIPFSGMVVQFELDKDNNVVALELAGDRFVKK